MKRFLSLVFFVLMFAGCSDNSSLLGENWDTIEAEAKGSTVNYYMYGGLPAVNEWIDTYVAEEVKKLYDITLVRVPLSAGVAVSRLAAEQTIGKDIGAMDLVWINGKHFKKARKLDILYGPFVEKLPNYIKHVNKQMAAYDFGQPVAGYEAPFGWTQFVFEYDSAALESPPHSFNKLLEWVKDNPGRFTYVKPPDFTGSAFIRQAFYATTGGLKMYQAGWNPSLFEKESPKVWAYLNEMKPYLWRKGETYPATVGELDTLFATAEIDFGMSYSPLHAQAKIEEGLYPDSVRTFVMDDGTVFNMHFNAIPKSAPNKAGAMVVANFLLSPDAQYSKFQPSAWGDYPAINLDTLTKENWDKFAGVHLGAPSLAPEVLAKASVPEIAAEYVEALEKGWEENVRSSN